MQNRQLYFLGTLVLTLTVIVLLLTGSSILTVTLDKDNSIPAGTLITWIGMISLPLTIYWGVKELRKPSGKLNGVLSSALKVMVILGSLWLPISYLLAGNLSFTFSEKETFQGGQAAMRWFWLLTYGIGIGALSVLLTYWLSSLFLRDSN